MTEENILRALRAQAWERAKGELRAVSATFFGAPSAREGQFDKFEEAVHAFVLAIEGDGLAE